MRRILLFALGLTLCASSHSFASSDYAGELLSLGVGARAAGMGNAFVAVSNDASASYWNAAGLSLLGRSEALLMHAERFAGLVNYNLVSYARPLQQEAGLGVLVFRLGIDGIKYTELEDPGEPLSAANRPRVKRTASSADYVVYLAYGRRLRERLSLGGSAKLIRRKIGDNTAFGYGVDVGLLYLLGPVSVGLNLRNLTSSPVHWDTGTMDRILPSVDFAVAYTQPIAILGSKLTGTIGTYQDKDFSGLNGADALNLGLECKHSDALAVRIGSTLGKLTAGLGLRFYDRAGVDYAFSQHRQLGNSHRLSVSLWL